MAEERLNVVGQEKDTVNTLVDEMTLFDDDLMSRVFDKNYAKDYAVKEKIVSVKNLMENMKLTLDQALNALGIQGDERKLILEQLQK